MSDSWVCLGGLPDVRDRQRSFYTYCRGKNVVHECKGEFEHRLIRWTGCMYVNSMNFPKNQLHQTSRKI